MDNCNQGSKKGIAYRRQREREDRRESIISAAKNLYISQGIQNTTMDHIAIESELSKGTLYHYFESKEELQLAVASNIYKDINSLYENAIKKANSLKEKLRMIILAYYGISQQYPKCGEILHYIKARIPYDRIIQKENNNQKLSRNEIEFKTQMEYGKKILENTINEELKEKKYSSTLNPKLIYYLLVTIVTGVTNELFQQPSHLQNNNISNEETLEIIIDWITKGLTSEFE